jgi:ketosteroid isomerase-like protein
MRRSLSTIAGLTLLVFATACTPAPATPPAPAGPAPAEMITAANALDQRFLDAFNKGDVDALMATYWNSPDLVSFGPDGMGTKGFDAARAEATEMVKAMPGAKLEFLAMHNDVRGEVVLGWGTWKMTMTTPQGPQVLEGRYTDVKALRDGKWVYLMDHASVPLPPPPGK